MSRGLEGKRREKAAQCYPSRAVQSVSRGLVAAGMEEKRRTGRPRRAPERLSLSKFFSGLNNLKSPSSDL